MRELSLDARAASSVECDTIQSLSNDEGEPPCSPSQQPCLDDFDLLHVIGRGSYGKVMCVKRKVTGGVYALKVLKKSQVLKGKSVKYVWAERSAMTKVDHPFLTSMRWAFQTEHKLYMVLDYQSGGELFFHLHNAAMFSEVRETQPYQRLYVVSFLTLDRTHDHLTFLRLIALSDNDRTWLVSTVPRWFWRSNTCTTMGSYTGTSSQRTYCLTVGKVCVVSTTLSGYIGDASLLPALEPRT